MEIQSELGLRIRYYRKQRGLSQEKLAELIGIEPQSLSYMETGKFSPSPDTLQKLGEILNVKPYEFYYFEDITEDEMIGDIIKALKEDKKFLRLVYNIYKSIQYE